MFDEYVRSRKAAAEFKDDARRHVGVLRGHAASAARFFLPEAAHFLVLQDSLGVLAPIVLCLGAHGVMFFFMGKSCHGGSKSSNSNAPVAIKTAVPTSTDA